jgi:hypothetical protein
MNEEREYSLKAFAQQHVTNERPRASRLSLKNYRRVARICRRRAAVRLSPWRTDVVFLYERMPTVPGRIIVINGGMRQVIAYNTGLRGRYYAQHALEGRPTLPV